METPIFGFEFLNPLLEMLGIPSEAALTVAVILSAVIIGSFVLGVTTINVWLERRVAAVFQDRIGPNRVGPAGLLQTIADAFKLFTKENIFPEGVDKLVFAWSPLLGVMAVMGIWAVVPFASNVYGIDLNVGVLYIVAIGGIGTLAIMMMGWSSNNKYALLGSFRTASQLISYEVPMLLALLIPVLLTGSMSVNDIVKAQSVWWVFAMPIPALVLLISNIAEIGRGPFDLIEAESEIVAGFHIEYSGARFAMIFLAEFAHAFTVGALVALFYFGGWRGPGVEAYPYLGILYFLIKAFGGFFVVMWIRATLPRVRIDQMNDFNWKFLVPLSLTVLVVTILLDKALITVTPFAANAWVRAAVHLLANLVIMIGTVQILRSVSQRWQKQETARMQAIAARVAGD
ncbi:MAG TPA: NADH-quinone oxidoreductase subunit NuoH [Anaerolineales bacterium]|nr:NADH-quinone oxidoreductase subunit NuoH [Anaerolineales bacterium]